MNIETKKRLRKRTNEKQGQIETVKKQRPKRTKVEKSKIKENWDQRSK